MQNKSKYSIANMPFLIGMFNEPNNPNNLPNILPFNYWYDDSTATLKQTYTEEIASYLDEAYESGSLLGTPMNEDGLGRIYLEDFFSFISEVIKLTPDKSVLEIGCGMGFLLSEFKKYTPKVLGIEPGKSSKSSWDKLQINVVNDFFPSKKITNKFDVIVSYCVLEHIAEDKKFIEDMIIHLNQSGKIFIAVPNCEEQLKNCDPSIFVHEHYSYHSMDGLVYLLSRCGLKVTDKKYSNHGGLLFVCAEPSNNYAMIAKPNFNIDSFAANLNRFCENLRNQIEKISEENKSLGIYCAARAIAGLPLNENYRFFDDDPNIHGLFYPPFNSPVENMDDLISNPVDELWIFSYYFADIIEAKIKKHESLSHIKIVKLIDMVKKQGSV